MLPAVLHVCTFVLPPQGAEHHTWADNPCHHLQAIIFTAALLEMFWGWLAMALGRNISRYLQNLMIVQLPCRS